MYIHINTVAFLLTYFLVAKHSEGCGGHFDNKCFIFKHSNARLKELAI